MSNSSLITDYCARGTFANRPATPGPIPAGCIAFYFATDTVVLYMWTGAAWVIAGSGTGGAGAGAPTYDWNPKDGRSGNIYIHGNDGKSFTGNNTGTRSAMRGFASHAAASGKFYFEFKVLVVSNFSPFIGVGTSAAGLDNYVGNDAFAWGMLMDARSFHTGSSNGQNAYAANDIVGVAVDFTATTGSIKFLKNNAAQLFDYTGLTLGTMFPMGGVGDASTGASGTLNLRAVDQTYAPPAGYSAWS